jgi:ribosomal RNA-processing protein 36
MEDVSFKEQLKGIGNLNTGYKVKVFKKNSKHAPKEISSKIPASKFKKIKFFDKEDDPNTGKFVKKIKPRDPRFDKLSGHFNQGLFEASYSFLDEYREKELEELKQAMENKKNAQNYQEIHKIYLKKKQEIQKIKDKAREIKIRRDLMKNEREKVKTGKKPFFFKQRLVKMIAMQEKIKELKQKGEYEEYSRKKRKREISNNKSELFSLPTKRRIE